VRDGHSWEATEIIQQQQHLRLLGIICPHRQGSS
jgi:hypothetical protein